MDQRDRAGPVVKSERDKGAERLNVPAAMLAGMVEKHTSPPSDEDWNQCDVVNCGRWYQRARPLALQAHAAVHMDGRDAPSFTVAVYELRWACPYCSDTVNGLELSHTDKFQPVTRAGRGGDGAGGADGGDDAGTSGRRNPPPCDWCRDQELDTCSQAEHNKMDWDGDAEHDYLATGVQLPPNWIAGYRTRSTDIKPYKVFLMSCCACGEVLQPDRAKRVLAHMNARNATGRRACIVPELDYLFVQASRGEGQQAQVTPRPALDPAAVVDASPAMEKVFKFRPRKELSDIATSLHRELIHAIANDEAVRSDIFSTIQSPSTQSRLLDYSREMVTRLANPNFNRRRKAKDFDDDEDELDLNPARRQPQPARAKRAAATRPTFGAYDAPDYGYGGGASAAGALDLLVEVAGADSSQQQPSPATPNGTPHASATVRPVLSMRAAPDSPTTAYERMLKRRTNGASLADTWGLEPRPGATHVRSGALGADAAQRLQLSTRDAGPTVPGYGGGGGGASANAGPLAGSGAGCAAGHTSSGADPDASGADVATLRQLVASLRGQLQSANSVAAREMLARHEAEAATTSLRVEAGRASDRALLEAARADRAEARAQAAEGRLRQWQSAWGGGSTASAQRDDAEP